MKLARWIDNIILTFSVLITSFVHDRTKCVLIIETSLRLLYSKINDHYGTVNNGILCYSLVKMLQQKFNGGSTLATVN